MVSLMMARTMKIVKHVTFHVPHVSIAKAAKLVKRNILTMGVNYARLVNIPVQHVLKLMETVPVAAVLLIE